MASTDSLTKDLIPDPSQWRLSMMLTEHTLEVVINSSHEDNALIYRSLPLDYGMKPLVAFEDLIYENPLLLADFKRVDMLVDTLRYTFLPNALVTEQTLTDAIQALWTDPQLVAVPNPVDGTTDTLVLGLDSGTLSFMRRTFLDSQPLHPMTVLASYFLPLSRQGNTGKLYAYLREDSVDVMVIDHRAAKGEDSSPLRLACTYSATTAEDAAYYILAAALQSGLSLASDEMRLCGNQQKREAVSPILRQAASYVMPVIFPSEIFRAGRAAIEAPFPLILLPLV